MGIIKTGMVSKQNINLKRELAAKWVSSILNNKVVITHTNHQPGQVGSRMGNNEQSNLQYVLSNNVGELEIK